MKMNGLLNIISTASNLPTKQLIQFLDGYETHQSFSQKASHELDITVTLITNSLNSHEKKFEGLLLLRTFVTQCQLDIIEQKGSLWLSLCTKICMQKKPLSTVSLSYDVISNILTKSIIIPDLSKTISSTLLSKIIESVNGLPSECYFAALKCLEICMKLYAGPCGSSRGIIDRFLCGLVDSTNRSLVLQAGKCLHLLQQVRGGGGGVQGMSQKGAWSLLQSQLLGSLHRILDDIYANTMETYDGNMGDAITLKIAELNLSAEPLERAVQLVTRFKNLCEYLRVALCEPFPAAKAVSCNLLFALISRGLAVDCQTLSRNLITDNIAIGSLLPQIHVSLYSLLDSLILLMRSNLLPLSNMVCETILQTLKWTSSGKASGFRRPYSSIRQAAYQTLSIWCKTMQYGCLVETIAEDLIRFIIQDATPFQSEVTLKVLAGSRKYLSKKARQKLHKAQNDASNIAQMHSKAFNPHNTKIIYTDNGNEPLCMAALNCLAQVLNVAGCFLKPIHQKILQEKIVSIALSITHNTQKPSTLYFNAMCRDALYVTLFALVESPHHLCPPPLQYAIEIFRIAQIQDTNALIRERCAAYMRGLEKIIHPQKEIFYFPTDPNEVKAIFKRDGDETGKTINLGWDSEDVDEDIEIDLTDGVQVATQTIATQTNENSNTIDQMENETKSNKVMKSVSVETIPFKASSIISIDTSSQSSQSSEAIAAIEDAPLTSSPRKSARLSAKRERSDSMSSHRSITDSPIPKRRSTRRLSSISMQESSPNKTIEVSNGGHLMTIPENGPPVESAYATNSIENEQSKEDNTERINELLADFVDEPAISSDDEQ